MKLNITYDGQTISVADGQALTLNCKDKRARSNIVIEAVSDTPQPDTPTEYTLSGTWVFNENPILPSANIIQRGLVFNVNFWVSYSDTLDINNTRIAIGVGGTLDDNLYSGGVWDNRYDRKISFVGTQTVSKEFYEWFAANAQPLITDLTGTTWYVPSGWSAESGYGTYLVEGTFVREGETNREGSLYRISIGYNFYSSSNPTLAEDQVEIKYNKSSSSSESCTTGDTYSFTFTFTGGTDATNPDLISWLYANGELQIQ